MQSLEMHVVFRRTMPVSVEPFELLSLSSESRTIHPFMSIKKSSLHRSTIVSRLLSFAALTTTYEML